MDKTLLLSVLSSAALALAGCNQELLTASDGGSVPAPRDEIDAGGVLNPEPDAATVEDGGIVQEGPPASPPLGGGMRLGGMVTVSERTMWTGDHKQSSLDASFQLITGSVIGSASAGPTDGDQCTRRPWTDVADLGGAPVLFFPERASLNDGKRAAPFLIPGQDNELLGLIAWLDPAGGLQPRRKASYRFEAHGGDLDAPFVIPGIELPPSVALPELEGRDRFDVSNPTLRWTGSSEGMVDVSFLVRGALGPTEYSDSINCRFADDGVAELPEMITNALVGRGVVEVEVARIRDVAMGDPPLHVVAEARTRHRLAFGEACQRPELRAACEAYAQVVIPELAECPDPWEPPPVAVVCPSFVDELCDDCPEYFECLAASAQCNGTYVEEDIGCGCSAP